MLRQITEGFAFIHEEFSVDDVMIEIEKYDMRGEPPPSRSVISTELWKMANKEPRELEIANKDRPVKYKKKGVEVF